jgi:TorA maturation chaperone TorD
MADAHRDTVDDMLARAVVYRTLSLGFQAPTDDRLRRLGAQDGFRAATAALRRLGLDCAADRLSAVLLPDGDTLAATYWRLFGHTTSGPICACETEYGPDNSFHQPQQLADISGYYLAFGLRPSATSEARADHIACECEFLDFLSRKEALWSSHPPHVPDGDATLDVTRRAVSTFLRDHLGRFGRAFATRVIAEDPAGYFGGLGHVLLAFVESECARLGVQAGPLELAVCRQTPDEAPMACGTASELIQIQRGP